LRGRGLGALLPTCSSPATRLASAGTTLLASGFAEAPSTTRGVLALRSGMSMATFTGTVRGSVSKISGNTMTPASTRITAPMRR